MSEAVYRLERGLVPSLRLNLQHYLFRAALGYDLHPAVLTRKEGLRVADVGTGTCIWLAELAGQMPTSAEFVGFDVSEDQFPHPANMPGKFAFVKLDARQPPPPEHCGTFDIVHLRLFSAVVDNCDPSVFIKHAEALLKPDGFLQWTEFDNAAMAGCSIDGEAPDASLDEVCKQFNLGSRTWVARLPQWFEKYGFGCILSERRREPAWARSILLDNCCLVTEESAIANARVGRITDERAQELIEAVRRVKEEGRRGAYFKQIFQVVVGQKRAGP